MHVAVRSDRLSLPQLPSSTRRLQFHGPWAWCLELKTCLYIVLGVWQGHLGIYAWIFERASIREGGWAEMRTEIFAAGGGWMERATATWLVSGYIVEATRIRNCEYSLLL